MSHITSIGAAIYTDLAVAIGTTTAGIAGAPVPSTFTKAGFDALFGTSSATALKYLRVANIREFPAFGAQPNLVKVPVYGQKTTSTIGGQSDAPDFSVTINYVPSEWAAGTTSTTWLANNVATKGNEFANMVGDGKQRAWRLTLLNSKPSGATEGAALSQWDSLSGGIGCANGTDGANPNSMFYFMGKLESMLITPSLTDSVQATLAFSIQSDIYGAFTV